MPSRATIFCILFLVYLLLLLLLLLLYLILYFTLDPFSNFSQIYYGIAQKVRVQSGSFLLLDSVYNKSEVHKKKVSVEVQKFRHGTRWAILNFVKFKRY